MKNKKTEIIFLLITTTVISFIFGFQVSKNSIDDDRLDKILNQIKYIEDNYYEEIDEEKLINGALKGMVESLEDPYSTYMEEEESESFNRVLDGTYIGLGIEVFNDKEGNVIINNIFKGSPGEKENFKKGDIIIKINDYDLTGKTSNDMIDHINKYDKPLFKITIKRENENIELKVKKREIILTSVTSEKITNQTGYIKINIFASNTYSQFEQQLNDIVDSSTKKLIIDLRDNTGGHLHTVVNIMELFLNEKQIMYQTKMNKKEKEIKRASGKESIDYEIVLLTNESTASASEMLVASLKENLKAKQIGKTTYGKGLIQELKNTDNSGLLKLSTKKWMTPTGKFINKIGIEPDLIIEQSEEYYLSGKKEDDTQLQEAIK